MPRGARIVMPEYPHHVIQRGNRRQKVFLSDNDKSFYLRLLKLYAFEEGVKVLAYCLMENHVHLIVVPSSENSLRKCMSSLHRRYTININYRENWRGYLWQGRFLSYPMNERYTYAAIRYVELNPVRAGLVKQAEEYPWSSARCHMFGKSDGFLSDHEDILKRIGNWADYLDMASEEKVITNLQRAARDGRPLI